MQAISIGEWEINALIVSCKSNANWMEFRTRSIGWSNFYIFASNSSVASGWLIDSLVTCWSSTDALTPHVHLPKRYIVAARQNGSVVHIKRLLSHSLTFRDLLANQSIFETHFRTLSNVQKVKRNSFALCNPKKKEPQLKTTQHDFFHDGVK